MATTAFDNGFVIVKVRYVITRSDGALFYQRRVPRGLEGHHGGKSLIRKSLGTKSITQAAQKARALAAQHDALWRTLRDPEASRLGMSTQETRAGAQALLKSLGLKPGEAAERWYDDSLEDHLEARYADEYREVRNDPRASDENVERLLTPVEKEAIHQYYRKPDEKRYYLTDALALYTLGARSKKFKQDTERSIQRVVNAVGDLPLDKYDRDLARKVVECWTARARLPPP